jgi:hypothetical protein
MYKDFERCDVLEKIWNLVKEIIEKDKKRTVPMITIDSKSQYLSLKSENAQSFDKRRRFQCC